MAPVGDGSQPTVSVALCTHNGAPYIREQLESILHQSRRPNELIVSDDASTDETLSIVDAVIAEDAARPDAAPVSFTVLRNTSALGVVGNFSQAIDAATRDLVALSDQDDVWRHDRLARLVGEFMRHPDALLLHSDARVIDADGRPRGYSLFEALELTGHELELEESGRGFAALQRRNLVTGATAVFRRSIVDGALPVPDDWVHDEWLAIVASALGRIDVVREQLIDYRQHASNQIGVTRLSLRGKVRRVMEPRGNRYEYLLRRSEQLVDRLEILGDRVPQAILEDARAKRSHLGRRSQLPSSRVGRIAPVLREALSGRYSRYGRGPGDVLRDLVQPAGNGPVRRP